MEIYNTSAAECYFLIYRLQDLKVKQIQQSHCREGIQWAWIYFGECLLQPTQVLGYWLAAFGLPLYILGTIKTFTKLHSRARRDMIGWLVLSLIQSIISFVGVVLSMQIMLLVAFGIVATVVNFVLTVGVATVVYRGKIPTGKGRYSKLAPHRVDGREIRYKIQTSSASKLWCLPLGALFLATTVLINDLEQVSEGLGISQRVINDSKSIIFSEVKRVTCDKIISEATTHRAAIVGYILGCVACFMQWRLQLNILKLATKCELSEASALRRRPLCSKIMLMSFDLLFALGVLLQSGGFRILCWTLPWVLIRLIDAWLQFIHLDINRWTIEDVDSQDGEPTTESDKSHLLGSSDSEGSEAQAVLFDQTCTRDINDRRYSQVMSEATSASIMASGQALYKTLNGGRMSLCKGRRMSGQRDFTLTSTTCSDCTSTSWDQELEWRYNQLSPRNITCGQAFLFDTLPYTSYLRHKRPSLKSLRLHGLINAPSESYDQRVRTWVSQHTPEEEFVPLPSLALALNLDTTTNSLPSPNNPSVDELRPGGLLFPSDVQVEEELNRPGKPFSAFGSAVTMIPRKNSL